MDEDLAATSQGVVYQSTDARKVLEKVVSGLVRYEYLFRSWATKPAWSQVLNVLGFAVVDGEDVCERGRDSGSSGDD